MADDRFTVHETPLRGLKVVERTRLGDSRGFLSRLFCRSFFSDHGFEDPVEQINHTLTHAIGAIRGMHFQRSPHGEDKLVTCLAGAVFDVAVDVRRDSDTFLRWHGEVLSADNQRALLIPKGFAHGFQTMSADCQLLYLHTAAYHPGAEGALNPLDPRLAIAWPRPVTEMSDRDRSHPMLDDNFTGITI